jgi:hypothetical protein
VPTNSDGVSQVTQQKEEEDLKDEERRFTQIIVGSAAAAILLMMAAIMLFCCRRKTHTEEPTQQEHLKRADLTVMEHMDEDEDVEIESESSDSTHKSIQESIHESTGKFPLCCEDGLGYAADTCREFSDWIGSTCSPTRVRPYETEDTVQF